jgi:hypothetical protein
MFKQGIRYEATEHTTRLDIDYLETKIDRCPIDNCRAVIKGKTCMSSALIWACCSGSLTFLNLTPIYFYFEHYFPDGVPKHPGSPQQNGMKKAEKLKLFFFLN